MKDAIQDATQHVLTAVGIAIWFVFGVAGVGAGSAHAHEYTYQCPNSGILVSHPSQCRAPAEPAEPS